MPCLAWLKVDGYNNNNNNSDIMLKRRDVDIFTNAFLPPTINRLDWSGRENTFFFFHFSFVYVL